MDEPSVLYRCALFHFGSGDSLFVGLLALSLAVWIDSRKGRPALSALCVLIGILWILLASWPSLWMQGVLIASCMTWLLYRWRLKRLSPERMERARQLVYITCLIAMVSEKPFQFIPRFPPIKELAVIGDSVTAGLNDHDITWPRVMAEQHGISVHDASQQGATCHSARQQVHWLAGRGDAVLLEIGGNDVLEYIPVEKYAVDLEQLLRDVRTAYPTQPVALCELPLPPLGHRYGSAQRRLAARYQISLIPKRDFLRVLTMPRATVDGIHLSDLGQELLAGLMTSVLQDSVTATPAEYHRYEPIMNLR